MDARGSGGAGYSLSPEGNKPGKVSPLTPQTPHSGGKRDSGYLTDYSPASTTSAGRHFTFESPFPPEDEADEEELSALGAVGGQIGGSRQSRASSITPEIDVFSPPTMMELSGRRSRGRPSSRTCSVTPDIDVFLPTPEVDEEEEELELAQVKFNDNNLFSVVEPTLPAPMQPPNFVSRPIPIPHCMASRLASENRLPGEVQGHMRYPTPSSCPLSNSSTLYHSANTFGSPRSTLMYFGHVGTLSRTIGTQTPNQHSLIIQDLMHGGIDSHALARGSAHVRLRHHSEGEYSEEARTTFRLSPLPDLVPVSRDRSISLPNVPALSQPEIEVGRELRRISDEFHFDFIRGSVSPRHRLQAAGAQAGHPSSYPGDRRGGIWQSLRWWIHTSSLGTGSSPQRRLNPLPPRSESTPPARPRPPPPPDPPGDF